MNALQALHNRDPDALDQAFNSLEEAAAFRNDVLPLQSPADCKWFWQQVMTPEQLTRTLNAVRDVCIRVAADVGLTLNQDFTAAVDAHGDPILIAKPDVQRVFYAALPPERHSILRFYLQKPMA